MELTEHVEFSIDKETDKKDKRLIYFHDEKYRKQGTETIWYLDSNEQDEKICSRVNYVDEELDGNYEYYSRDGVAFWKGSYTKGVKKGDWHIQNRIFRTVVHYDNYGKLTGTEESYYNDSNRLKQKIVWNSNKTEFLEEYWNQESSPLKRKVPLNYNGTENWYYPDGKQWASIQWKDGKKHGKTEIFDDKGYTILKEFYSNGELIGEAFEFYPSSKKMSCYRQFVKKNATKQGIEIEYHKLLLKLEFSPRHKMDESLLKKFLKIIEDNTFSVEELSNMLVNQEHHELLSQFIVLLQTTQVTNYYERMLCLLCNSKVFSNLSFVRCYHAIKEKLTKEEETSEVQVNEMVLTKETFQEAAKYLNQQVLHFLIEQFPSGEKSDEENKNDNNKFTKKLWILDTIIERLNNYQILYAQECYTSIIVPLNLDQDFLIQKLVEKSCRRLLECICEDNRIKWKKVHQIATNIENDDILKFSSYFQ